MFPIYVAEMTLCILFAYLCGVSMMQSESMLTPGGSSRVRLNSNSRINSSSFSISTILRVSSRSTATDGTGLIGLHTSLIIRVFVILLKGLEIPLIPKIGLHGVSYVFSIICVFSKLIHCLNYRWFWLRLISLQAAFFLVIFYY